MKKLEKLNELIKKAEDIIKKVKQGDKICLIFHDDSDGVCSAALFSILIHNLTGNYPDLFPAIGTEIINNLFLSRVRNYNPDFVFVFDITVDPKELYNFKGFVLDHHIFSKIESVDEMPYLNPHYFEEDDEKVPPTSCMAYLILKRFPPEEKVAWIAGIGITEDHHVNTCKDVFEKIQEESSELLKVKQIDQESVEKSFFGELGDMIRSGRMLKGSEGAITATLALVECKDRPDKLVNGLTQHSLALRRFYDKVSYEAQNYINDVERKARFHNKEKVIMYEQPHTKLKGLTSFIADKIRQKYPEWISYVINKEYGGGAKISIRLEQGKRNENLVAIVEKIKEKIPSIKGGGHKAAIGVVLDQDYIQEFEEEFLRLLGK